MVYVLGKKHGIYRVVDIRTSSVISLDIENLKTLTEIDGNYIANGYIKNNKVVIYNESLWNDWFKSIVVGKVDKSRYLVANLIEEYSLELCIYSEEDVREVQMNMDIINGLYENGRISFVNTVDKDIAIDEVFEKEIEKEFNKFKIKSRVLGLNIDLDYVIVGRDIVLTFYENNTNNKLIIPKFITSLGAYLIGFENIPTHIKYLGAYVIDEYVDKLPDCVEYFYNTNKSRPFTKYNKHTTKSIKECMRYK